MKKRHYRQVLHRFLFVFFGVVIWISAGSIAVTKAQQAQPAGIDPNEQIKISADTLTVNNEARYAEFSGHVKAEQGDTSIRADTIRIFYKAGVTENKEKEGKQSTGEDAIEKIVANGNVKIRFENRVAVSDEAVYITKTRVLVLSGANTKITSGNDSISGGKITLYRDEGRINIDSDKKSRVEAVFYPGEKGGLR